MKMPAVADVRFAPPRWLAWGSVAAVLALYVFVAWTTMGPEFAADEVGMVGNSRVIAGALPEWHLAGNGYMPGLAVLMAPMWWFTDDPYLVYWVGLAWGVVASVATIWPLARIAQHVSKTSIEGGVVLAAIVMAFPARTIPANDVVGEALLTLFTALAVEAAFRYVRDRSWRAAGQVGLWAALAFFAHGRAVALIVAAMIWLVMASGRRWRHLLTGAAFAGVVSAIAWGVYLVTTNSLYGADTRVRTNLNAAITMDWMNGLGGAFGAAWYLMLAWPAIGLLGVAWAVRGWRRLGGVEWLLALATGGGLLLELLSLHLGQELIQPRLDLWIYGRYMDHTFTVLALIGLATIVARRSYRDVITVTAASVAIGIGFMLVTVPRIPVGGRWTTLHVGGVAHFLSTENYINSVPEPWLLLTAAATAIGALVALLAVMRSAIAVLAVAGFALSVADDVMLVDPASSRGRVYREMNELIQQPGLGEPVAVVPYAGTTVNMMQFAVSPTPVQVYDMDVAAQERPGIYASIFDESPLDYGAKRVALEQRPYNLMLWLFPGPLYDEYEAKGLLTDESPVTFLDEDEELGAGDSSEGDS